MASQPTQTDPTLLSLPDEILRIIFNHITTTTKYSLHSTIDAINLANANNRLRRIFSSQLTHITPFIATRYAHTLSPDNFEKLIRIAGENLRELHIPACYHSYIEKLPDICPKLEALHFVERSHISKELAPFDTDDEYDEMEENDSDDDTDDNQNESEAEDISEERCSYNGSCDEQVNHEDVSENNVCEDTIYENNDTDTVNDKLPERSAGQNDNGENDSDADYFNQCNVCDNGFCEDHFDESFSRCPVVDILPRLNLRKLTVFRLSEKLCDTIMTKMAHHPIQELHLHRIRKYQLPLLIPLLSHPLQALTVTVSEWGYDPCGRRISKFIDALIPAVSRIPVVTFHSPGERRLSTYIQYMVNIDTFSLPNRAASLIASVRKNNGASKCCSINLAGENTFRILSAVDRNASITLSSDRITVRDEGNGTHITSLPLYEEFLDEDLTHLEKAYLKRRWDSEGEEIVSYEWNPEWGVHLAGRRLQLIRSYDAGILNELKLSTEVLELLCAAIPDISDWSFLAGVRELYLLEPPTNSEYDDCTITIEALLEALPRLVDAFRGEFICVGSFQRPDCIEFPDPAVAIQNVIKTKDSIDRFVRRGGDAATLCWYIDAVLSDITICTKSG